MLADGATELDAARLLVQRAAASLSGANGRAAAEIAIARHYAARASRQACRAALALLVQEPESAALARHGRNLRMLELLDGAGEETRAAVARHALQQE
jgi:alkylation response protein AidB-like acyl-CoA dehydrogenase